MAAMTEDSKRVIIVISISNFLALLLMGLRLTMRKVRKQKYVLSDYLIIVAVICLLASQSMNTVTMVWGNNNLPEEYINSHYFSEVERYQRKVGSVLTLVNRVWYTALYVKYSLVQYLI
jgi:hypothetical protein